MAAEKRNDKYAGLTFAALQLLAPPVRLVSAAIWKVMKKRDVMQYGVVEEFVTSACETVPGLLTVRHQGKLALGLRARLILELCHTQPDVKVVEPHLKRIHAPASSSSSHTVRKDVKVIKTAEVFHSLVHTLLTDPAKREQFFKEKFPVEYGPTFDQELEKLLWEFLIRLDQLLPVPNLAQTATWLSSAPAVLMECALAATQPQLLKTLLQHQTCLGHLEPAASLPPNMGDSILDSLSLPLSGIVPSDQSTETEASAVDQSDGAQRRDTTPFITPVIGLISNEDVPVMNSASRRTVCSKNAPNKYVEQNENLKFTVVKQKQKSKDGEREEGEEQLQEEHPEEGRKTSKRSIRKKRKQPDQSQSESDEEEQEVLSMTRSGKRRMSRVRQGGGDQRTNKNEEEGAKTVRNEEWNRAELATCVSKLGVKTLHLPDDPSICSAYVSCLSSQPTVIIEKLSVETISAHQTGRRGKSSHEEQQSKRRKSPIKTAAHKNTNSQRQKHHSDLPGLDDKENQPNISSSPSQQQNNTETPAPPDDGEDYVADSEDEVTKNFKGRLFMKRYYKTRHGTYVPTLREFWKPGMTRRNLLSASSKHR